MKTVKRYIVFVFALALLLVSSMVASAQITVNTNMPDPTVIYTQLNTPFLNALTWVIAATAVLTVIVWIIKAVRRR